jgi:hypothetical protein
MLAAFVISLSGFKMTRQPLLAVSAVVVGISLLHVRHLQSWWEFRRDFKAILVEEKGFVRSEDHDDIAHWGWTNTILSYVWSEGEVEAIILNPESTGYVPFPVNEEMLLEKYLTKKPDFLEEKSAE